MITIPIPQPIDLLESFQRQRKCPDASDEVGRQLGFADLFKFHKACGIARRSLRKDWLALPYDERERWRLISKGARPLLRACLADSVRQLVPGLKARGPKYLIVFVVYPELSLIVSDVERNVAEDEKAAKRAWERVTRADPDFEASYRARLATPSEPVEFDWDRFRPTGP
jgi:hypothetical protein